jgi:hypothetical protein
MPRWTEESRKAQSERIRAQQPWRSATGPKSEEGKEASAQNALKHGLRSEMAAELRRVLRAQRALLGE